MKLTGAALLLAVGILLLWIASTGRLDRMKASWTYLQGKSELPKDATAKPIVKPISNPLNNVLDRPSYYVAEMMDTIQPGDFTLPGGRL